MPAPIIVTNNDPQNTLVEYYDDGDPARRAAIEGAWKRFNRADPASSQTFNIWYRPTNPNMELAVEHRLPAGSPPGRYRVETFVPGRHATARQVIFTVATNSRVENGQLVRDEPVTVVDMYNLYDVWQPLGEYDLLPAQDPLNGRVRQYALSLEDPAAEVAFGPVRWVPLTIPPVVGGAGQFDSPVGSDAERAGAFPTGQMMWGKYPVWCGQWFDINPYLTWYELGYHTGADLNLPGSSGADKGKPIYAVGDGTVIYAGPAGTWGNIVVIEHLDALACLPDGRVQHQTVYTRYGHVADVAVSKGQVVTRGLQVAVVGLPLGQTAGWHLHFDVCYTDLLKRRPAHWPNMDNIKHLRDDGVSADNPSYKKAQAAVMKEVVSNYLDPLRFIQDNH